MTKTEKAWLAAMIDGEGSIGICHSRNGQRSTYVRISITGTNPDLAKILQCNLGGNISWKKPVKNNHKAAFAWGMSGLPAVKLICEVYGYLVIKWPQAYLALAHQAIRDMNRRQKLFSLGHRKGWTYDENTKKGLNFIFEAVKRFNLRGKVDDPWKFIEETASA